MTLYALRPDPVTGSLEDAEVADEFKYGWQFLGQAITLWRLVDKDRADQIKAIKDRAALAAPEESRFYAEDLHELIRLLAGVDDAIVAAGIVDGHWAFQLIVLRSLLDEYQPWISRQSAR